jgi:hypothetical protein
MNGTSHRPLRLASVTALLFPSGQLVAATNATNPPVPVVMTRPAATPLPANNSGAIVSPSAAVPAAPATPGPVTSTNATPAPSATNAPVLTVRDLPEIHGKISLPKEWTLLPGKLLEGDALLATREKITGENDLWVTGLTMTIDRNGAKDSAQKASVYAQGLAEEAREKAGEEASPVRQSQSGAFREFRFDFPVAGDQPLLFTEVLRANDTTGTVATIVWQMPADEATKLKPLREAVLSGLNLDPSR